jgi:long-chain acyl-CoA synthetase
VILTAGDIGEWQPDGSMKIIDRKKNIFKLSQGEYVAVENLENIFGQTPGVDSVQLKNNLHLHTLSVLQQTISKHP